MRKEDLHECTKHLKVKNNELIGTGMFMSGGYSGSVKMHWLNVLFGICSNKNFTDLFSSSGKE